MSKEEFMKLFKIYLSIEDEKIRREFFDVLCEVDIKHEFKGYELLSCLVEDTKVQA
jgi:hypothetical protein